MVAKDGKGRCYYFRFDRCLTHILRKTAKQYPPHPYTISTVEPTYRRSAAVQDCPRDIIRFVASSRRVLGNVNIDLHLWEELRQNPRTNNTVLGDAQTREKHNDGVRGSFRFPVSWLTERSREELTKLPETKGRAFKGGQRSTLSRSIARETTDPLSRTRLVLAAKRNNETNHYHIIPAMCAADTSWLRVAEHYFAIPRCTLEACTHFRAIVDVFYRWGGIVDVLYRWDHPSLAPHSLHHCRGLLANAGRFRHNGLLTSGEHVDRCLLAGAGHVVVRLLAVVDNTVECLLAVVGRGDACLVHAPARCHRPQLGRGLPLDVDHLVPQAAHLSHVVSFAQR